MSSLVAITWSLRTAFMCRLLQRAAMPAGMASRGPPIGTAIAAGGQGRGVPSGAWVGAQNGFPRRHPAVRRSSDRPLLIPFPVQIGPVYRAGRVRLIRLAVMDL